MVAQSVLRTYESQHAALLLVIEDVPYAWTNHYAIAGTDYCGDGREVRNGLMPPTRSFGIDVWECWWQQSRMSFQIIDAQEADGGGHLAALFETQRDDEEALGNSFTPGEDLSGAAWDDIKGRHAGVEAIGTSGERRRYPFIPGWAIGDEHVGVDYENADATAATVSDDPLVFRGRRCALYRILRDVITYPDDETEGWSPWSEAERLWFGTLDDAGSVDGRRWTLEAKGPDSLFEKALGSLSKDEGVRFTNAEIELSTEQGNDETRIGIALFSILSSAVSDVVFQGSLDVELYGQSLYTTALTSTTRAGLIGEIQTAIDAAKAASGADGAFVDSHGQEVSMEPNGTVSIRIERILPGTANRRYAIMQVSLHEKVWTIIGFSPDEQGDPDLDAEGKFCGFRDADDSSPGSLGWADAGSPGPGYLVADFTTRGARESDQWPDFDNGGDAKLQGPLFPNGAYPIPQNLQSGYRIELGHDIVYHTGQYDRPVDPEPSDPSVGYLLGLTSADTHGYWLIEGPRRRKGEEDDLEEQQIAAASWISGNSNHYSHVDGTGGGDAGKRLILTKWLHPGFWGLPTKPLDTDWAVQPSADDATATFATPLLRLGYNPTDTNKDLGIWVLLRVMLSTGTSEAWTGFEGDPDATLDAGDNEPPGAPVVLDAELRDIGLAIPEDLVQSPATWLEEFAAVEGNPESKLRLMVKPGFPAVDLFQGLYKVWGMLPSLHGGRFGWIDLLHTSTPAQAQVVLTQSTKRGSEDAGAHEVRQELRAYSPIDAFAIHHKYDPSTGKFAEVWEKRSPDRGARYRTKSNIYTTKAYGVTSISDAADWRRLGDLAHFWEKRHFFLRDYPIKWPRPAQDVWPGTRVIITEPRAVGDGTYGIVAWVGIVTEIHHDTESNDFRATIFVNADSGSRLRLCAPIAKATAYDSENGRLTVEDDFLSLGSGDRFDANGFVEQEWSSIGGDALVKVLQYDGDAWFETLTGTVDAVQGATGDSWIDLTSTSGTYMRDMDALVVLQDYDQQDPSGWVVTWFGVICDEDGSFGVGPTSGWRWIL